MRNWVLLCASLALVALSGCAVMDALAGLSTDSAGNPVEAPPGSAPIDLLGLLLGKFLPGAAGIAGVLRWAWIEARKRKLDGVAKGLVAGVDDVVDAIKAGQPITKEQLYALLSHAMAAYGNADFARELVDKLKSEVRAAKD